MTFPLTAKLSSVAPAGRLQHKSVVLTGAAGNIGRYITRQLLKEGARVIMTGRTEKTLVRFVRELAAEGVEGHRVVPVAADAANPEDCRRVMAEVSQRFGTLDVLINNAGGAGPKRRLVDIPFTEGDCLALDESETMLDAARNLLGGPWNMTRAAVPLLAPGASIVNVSTIFSRTPYFGRIPYVVPKAGLNALSEGLASELGNDPRGIRVNLVYPGPIESERIDNVFAAMDGLQGFESGTTSKQFRDLMILRRGADGNEGVYKYPTPDDVASTILWLATPESSAFSGQSFEVTNGMQVPAESRSELVSWPDKRLVDLRGWVVLVLGGRDIEEALAFSARHLDHGANVVLAFRSLESLDKARRYVEAKNTRPMHLMLMDPIRRETVERTLQFVDDHFGRLDGAIVLPEGGPSSPSFSLTSGTDEQIDKFIRDEVVAPVAVASSIAKRLASWSSLEDAPAITFVTRSGETKSAALHQINRAAVEQLIRVWRCEDEHAVRSGAQRFACQPNQIVRYDNAEEDSLAFCAAWAATLTNRVRKMDEINLWVPKKIRRSTGKSAMPMSIQRVLPGLHQGKTAVITGGSVGIGLQLGRFLSLAGVRVLLAARDPKKLEAAKASIVEELESTGFPLADGRVFVMDGVDVGDEASLERLFQYAVELFGNVDMLINNAGIAGAEEMVVDMGLDAWNRTLEANLISNYSLIRKFAPLMKAAKHGKILNVSSYFGGEKYLAVPYPNRADYSVSKAGQRALAEIMSRHLGPEIQINALAPGPVDGLRLRGTELSPGLFMRRGRLILGNKRLNQVHAAILASTDEGTPIEELLSQLAVNRIEDLKKWTEAPAPIQRLLRSIERGTPSAVSTQYVMSSVLAPKLLARLKNGSVVTEDHTVETFNAKFAQAPEPFFDQEDVKVEASKVEEGIINRLHLKQMPTDEQVALSTVFSLADELVSGETFHPSGGLKFERSVTEGEAMLRPGAEDLAKLKGKNVVLIGEAMKEEMVAVAEGFAKIGVANIAVLTETAASADEIHHRVSRLEGVAVTARSIQGDIEGSLDTVKNHLGRVDIVVCAPFARIPLNALAAPAGGDWSRVLSRDDFAAMVNEQLTHHFRVARKAALWPRCEIVLVTPDTSRASSRHEFALALFIKNSLHAFTVTLGVESERLPTTPAVNQVQLTRRARTEEPGTEAEVVEEMERFVGAVLQCALPSPSPAESRYLARIYRGNAVTV